MPLYLKYYLYEVIIVGTIPFNKNISLYLTNVIFPFETS